MIYTASIYTLDVSLLRPPTHRLFLIPELLKATCIVCSPQFSFLSKIDSVILS